jgi:hypothetical protein
MPQSKISFSGDEDILAEVKAAARDDDESVSAWLIDAATAKLRNRALGFAINEAFAEHHLGRDEALAAYDAARRSAVVTGMSAA